MIGDDAVDQRALKQFYMTQYPDTQAVPSKPMKIKIRKNKKKQLTTENQEKSGD